MNKATAQLVKLLTNTLQGKQTHQVQRLDGPNDFTGVQVLIQEAPVLLLIGAVFILLTLLGSLNYVIATYQAIQQQFEQVSFLFQILAVPLVFMAFLAMTSYAYNRVKSADTFEAVRNIVFNTEQYVDKEFCVQKGTAFSVAVQYLIIISFLFVPVS